jgi:very-short-patch-repair endonuclease
VIEVDGSQHAKEVERDEHRTGWLASQDFRLLRFWDNDVLLQTDSVLEAIRVALPTPSALRATNPPPRPPPARGEGDCP